MHSLPNRRTLLKTGALAFGSVMSTKAGLATSLASPGPERTRLSQFDYPDVELLEGPLLDQLRQNHTFFMGLSEDALLKPFRLAAGMPAPGEDMGGWYTGSPAFDPPKNLTGYIPGHSFGQYVSGLARAYAITGDKPTQARVHSLVRGYAATISPKFWKGYCLPAYTSDKTTCGLVDACRFADQRDAMAILDHATDTVLPFLPEKALSRPEMEARHHANVAWTWDESYTLPENFFLAYQRGGRARYRDLAVRYLQDDTYFDPLAAGQNVLPGQHAYSHLNALCSALQAYLVTGSEKHLRAAMNGFDFVLKTQSFATGGWGPSEEFRQPDSDALAKSLTDTHASFETPCGAYGHFKVARYLMRITGRSTYGDSMESVLYNTVLGSLPIQEDGRSFYYSDYNNDASKGFHRDKWPCCSGTLPQMAADYSISSYFRAPGAVYVNLFVPSRVHWVEGRARFALEQRTSYPLEPVTTLRVRSDRPSGFAIHLRVPAWCGPNTEVHVNGKRVAAAPQPGTFLALQQEWRDGDTVEYHLDMPTILQPVDRRTPNTVALMYGPLALFASGSTTAKYSRSELLAARQRNTSADWEVMGSGGAAIFRPFFAIGSEHYRLYHEV